MAAEDTYGQLIEWFSQCEIDYIMFETMGNIQEIAIALDQIINISRPVWISLIMKNEDTLLDGTSIEETLKLIDSYEIDQLLINCNNIDLSIKIFKKIQSIRKLNLGLFPNLGFNEYENFYENIIDELTLRNNMHFILNLRPNVIGLCCGSHPSHIKLLKTLIREYKWNF